MRIAFVGTSGYDNASPRGRWLPVARELVHHGNEVHLLLLHPTFDRMAPGEREFVVEGVRVAHVAQMHVYGLPGARRYFGPRELAQVARRAALALEGEVLRVNPDAIHVCKPQPINGYAGWRAARKLGRPLYVDCDDYEAAANRTTHIAQRLIIRWFEDALPRRAAGVTVNTRFLQARCEALGVAPDRVIYVPNGADQPDPAHADPLPANVELLRGRPVVIYVGTLSTRSHGVDLLLEAFAWVVNQCPGARLLIVGDGDDRELLRARARVLGIDHSVTWTGRVSPERVPHLLAIATCSVDPVYDVPAMRGRSPLKIVESLAVGVPVVTGDVGDRREMLGEGKAGVIVPAGDADALARGLLQVLTDPVRRSALAAGARDQSERYRWPALAQRWMQVYQLVHPAVRRTVEG